MRGKTFITSFVAILSLSLLFTGISAGKALAFCERYPVLCGGWTQDHILLVPPIRMYEPFFELFEQRDRPALYKYREALKLVGHSCGATSGGWVITKRALEVLYPDEIPVRGDIRIYAPGAESEWNLGVIGEVITYITGAAPATGFSGAEFGNGFTHPMTGESYPGDPIYKRRNKMVYTEEPTGLTPPNQPFVDWIFERIDTGVEVCIRFMVGGPNGIQPPADANRRLMGAKVASGEATAEEAADYVDWWNSRIEYVFDNADTLVTECPLP